MTLAVDHPAVLWLGVLALLPLWVLPLRSRATPWLVLVPGDAGGRWLAHLLRGCGVAAIAGTVLGVAGLHLGAVSVLREGYGAHLVLLLDRSSSMDHSFAGKAPGGGEESKSHTAVRILERFIENRPHDRIGVAAFSTAPLYVLPLTDQVPALRAAVRAARLPGLAYTHVGKGLSLALDLFADEPSSGAARAVILVSDGAAAVDHDHEMALRRQFAATGARLYWIYLRTAGSAGLFEAPEDPRDDNWSIRPERQLHLLFQSFGIAYRAYEAERPEALARALEDIGRLERAPLRYRQNLPRRDLGGWCYGMALLAALGLLAAKRAEA